MSEGARTSRVAHGRLWAAVVTTLSLVAGMTLLASPAAGASTAGPAAFDGAGGEGAFQPSLLGGPRTTPLSVTGSWDVALLGDWNGDGTTTIGIVRGNTFHLRNSNAGGPAHITFTYGAVGDFPIAGDWNGDGTTTIGIVRGNTFHLRNSNRGGPADITFTYGAPDDTPIAGDWNGDGTTTIGIVRGNTFHLRNRNSGGAANLSFSYGRSSDTAVAGDWNGDGTDTIGAVRGNTWLLRNANSGGNASLRFDYGRAPVIWERRTGVPRPTLRPGDRGVQVRELQRQLQELRYWTGAVDGHYDTRTRDAVIAFQKVQGLSPDGVYGAATARALASPRQLSSRSSSGRWLEIDLRRRVAFTVVNGRVEWIFHASAGHGNWYQFQGSTYRATTTTGRQTITRQVNGVRVAARGRLYRPKYFDTRRGIAIHGFHTVPTHNASAGCVRVSNAAMDFIWSRNLAPIGTRVWVYPENFYN